MRLGWLRWVGLGWLRNPLTERKNKDNRPLAEPWRRCGGSGDWPSNFCQEKSSQHFEEMLSTAKRNRTVGEPLRRCREFGRAALSVRCSRGGPSQGRYLMSPTSSLWAPRRRPKGLAGLAWLGLAWVGLIQCRQQK